MLATQDAQASSDGVDDSNAEALLNPETSISIQKRHPYTGNLNLETSGDSKNAFLHCQDLVGLHDL